MVKKLSDVRLRIQKRIRIKIKGSPERPRLSVYKSNKHIYAEIIDDTQDKVITGASSLSPEIRNKFTNITKTEWAKKVGELIAKRAIEKGINKVVFDRNGFKYTGRIAALANAARGRNLQF